MLGAAATRDEEAQAGAKAFGMKQERAYQSEVIKRYGGNGVLCYCDGSTSPFPTEEVRRRAAMGAPLDDVLQPVKTTNLTYREQPEVSLGAKTVGTAVVGTVWDRTAGEWNEDEAWASAVQPPIDWDNEGAELVGLLLVTERALQLARDGRLKLATDIEGRAVVRFALVCLCDCQDPVKQVRTAIPGRRGMYWSTLKRILDNIKALRFLGVDTYVNWIPGHCAMRWNDVADGRAKQAGLGNGIDVHMQTDLRGGLRLPTPYSVVKRRITDQLLQVWHIRWMRAKSRTDRRLHVNPIAHVPSPYQWYSLGKGNGRGEDFVGRSMAATVDRVRLGAATTNDFLKHVGADGVRSGRCDMCHVVSEVPDNETDEQRRIRHLRTGERDSIDHRFDHCPCDLYTSARNHMKRALEGVEKGTADASLKDLMAMAEVKKDDRMTVVNAVRRMFTNTKLDRIVRRRKHQDNQR